jgi:hypothetical protein
MISGEPPAWRRTAAKGWTIAGLGTALLLAQADGAAAFPLIDPTNQDQVPQGTDLASPDAQSLQHQLQLGNGLGAPAGGGWTIVPSLNVDEMFTDNVLQLNSPRRWDLVTLVTPGISIAGDLPRLQVKLDYNPTLSLAARTDSQDGVSQSLNGTALLTLVPDLAFVDMRALASVQSTSGLLAGTSAGNVGTSISPTNNTVGLSNQDRIQTSNFQISPYLLHKFGDFGTGKLGVSASETQYATSTGFTLSPFPTGGGQGGKQFTTEEIAQFTTGEFLERFSDVFLVDLTQTTSSANGVINAEGNVTAIPTTTFNSQNDLIQDRLNYAANRWATVFGTIGHENISYPQALAQKINDMTWSVGVTLTPNPDSDLTISYGHQNGANAVQASVHYALTARTTVSGSYAQTLGSELQQIESQVQFGVIGPNGQFISGANGQPLIFNGFEPTDVTAVYRFNTFSMNIQTTLDRDTISLALVLGNQTTTGGIPSSATFNTFTAQWQHSLRPDLRLDSSITYATQTQTGGQQCFGTLLSLCGGPNLGDSTSYLATSVLTYTLTDSLSTHVRFSFYDRTSPLVIDRFYQSLLLVGFTKTF